MPLNKETKHSLSQYKQVTGMNKKQSCHYIVGD